MAKRRRGKKRSPDQLAPPSANNRRHRPGPEPPRRLAQCSSHAPPFSALTAALASSPLHDGANGRHVSSSYCNPGPERPYPDIDASPVAVRRAGKPDRTASDSAS